MVLKESDFDAEHELEELEKLVEESELKELKTPTKDQPQHGSSSITMWSNENLRSDEVFDNTTAWQVEDHIMVTSLKPKVELKTLPEHLEYAFLKENEQKPVISGS